MADGRWQKTAAGSLTASYGYMETRLKETKGYWCAEERNTPIAVREAKALVNTLETFSTDIYNGRIDAYVDNKNLVHFWNEAGGGSIPLKLVDGDK